MKSLAILTLACAAFGTLAEEGDGACLLQKPAGRGADENGRGETADAPELEDDDAGEQGISMVEGSFSATQTCYGYTGGTCDVHACAPFRNSKCQGGRCVCEAACAGADGKCYAGQTNALIAKDFTLTNNKFPKYAMYFQRVSAFGQLKATKAFSALNLGSDKFSLYKLPGNKTAFESRFFLGSMKWPSRVARIANTLGTASVSTHAFYATKLKDGKGPEELGLVVCYNRDKGALMFGRNDGAYWAYLQHGTWLVYAFKGAVWQGSEASVGDGGLWTPNPPFNPSQIEQLPAC